MKSGFLLIDKTKGVTSFDVVRQVKKILGIKKVGHAGTLDPLATGLLLIAFGEGTKFLEFLIGSDKVYEVVAVFGSKSDSYDADGQIEELVKEFSLDHELIEATIKTNFTGLIEQMPPKYSALKVGGKRAYDLARSGQDFELKKRKITVREFSLLKIDRKKATFRIECSSGTYIRSLINDLGEILGVGAYVEELIRTKIGHFSLNESVRIDHLNNKIDQKLMSIEQVAKQFSSIEIDANENFALKDGKVLMGKKIDQEVMAVFFEGKCLGFVEQVADGIKFRKRINLEV